jgi:hypothetical protein
LDLNRLTDLVLTLVVHDDDASKLIRSVLKPEWLESSVHQRLLQSAYDYIDRYGEAPKGHDQDLLSAFDERSVDLGKRVLDILRIQQANGINKPYVFDNLEQFGRLKRLLSGITEAQAFAQGSFVDEAENALHEILSARFTSFSPGLFLRDFSKLDFAIPEEDFIRLGIPALDDVGQVPTRKELYQLVAPAKRGKTWWLVHVGRQAILQRKNVLHVSLEMSEKRIIQRYVQSIGAVTKRPDEVKIATIIPDELGRLSSLEVKNLGRRPQFTDSAHLQKRIDGLRVGERLLIKEFPTRSLTFAGLVAYLDALESSIKFVPDVILLDYPKIMALPGKDLRIELGQLTEDLRGLAAKRNIIMCTVAQSNKEGARAGIVKDTHASEDWSQIGTADVTVTFSQTDSEHMLGVARLFLADGRNDVDKFEVLITQSYAMGQFVLDSVKVPLDYQTRLKEALPLIENA